MRWRKPASRGTDGEFLSGTQSDLADFGDSGADGFASAWDASPLDPKIDSSDDLFEGFEDRASQRSRDLDRRSRSGLVVLALMVIAGLGIAVAVRSGFLGNSDDATTAQEEGPNELAAIGDDRSYAEGPANVVLEVSGMVDRAFIAASSAADPQPIDRDPAVSVEATFGTAFWGGRTHVVVTGRGLDLSVDCVVATLVTAELRVIDLAAHGACGDDFAPTGDRLACLGDEVILLEVWPYDPDSVVERPPVEGVRVRIQRRSESSDSIASIRGSAVLGGDLAAESTPLAGSPGTTANIRIGDLSGSCELLDRAEVPVQLL